jgi:hypothetical protein
MLWREAEITSALSDVGAKALLTASHINGTDHCAIAMRAAASLFSIRHVCVFGRDLSGGVASFDSVESGDAACGHRRSDEARHAAVVTFETTARGPQPVARNHRQILAGAMAAFGSRMLPAGVPALSAVPLSSFAGLALTVLPWLRSGGALVLHQPFDAEQFFAQQRLYGCAIVTAPARLAGVVASEVRRRGGARALARAGASGSPHQGRCSDRRRSDRRICPARPRASRAGCRRRHSANPVHATLVDRNARVERADGRRNGAVR